jgi:asparagine synthase (glutamine-hydrolysing)
LRQLSSSLLPKEIWENRDKRPFGVPGTFWRTRKLHDFAKDILLSQESLDRGVFRPEALRAACADDGPVILFWSLVNVELWFKIFIDQNPFWIQKAKDRAAALSDS